MHISHFILKRKFEDIEDFIEDIDLKICTYYVICFGICNVMNDLLLSLLPREQAINIL